MYISSMQWDHRSQKVAFREADHAQLFGSNLIQAQNSVMLWSHKKMGQTLASSSKNNILYPD